MTKDKAQKRAIRARMAKTGERYTTARRYLLDLHHPEPTEAAPLAVLDSAQSAAGTVETTPPAASPAPSAQHPAPTSWVADPGMSDAAVRRATGKSWEEWIALLDAWDATAHTHAEIARHLYETYGIDGWWAQGVTVGYERARGMRAMHERADGFFSLNVSKTFPIPIERLFAAFVEEDQRGAWLDGVELRPRTSQPHKSARFDVLPGETRLVVNFIAKGDKKASAHIQHERLPAAEEVERWRTIWKAQLACLADYLARE
jgi:hypothetical protein